jgi:ankyrin repeat protein
MAVVQQERPMLKGEAVALALLIGAGRAKVLIDKGADVGAKDSDGNTPLQLASENRREQAEALLRKHLSR